MAALKRVAQNTIEKCLLNAKGEFAGVAMYESAYAVCTENGAQTLKTDVLYEGRATD